MSGRLWVINRLLVLAACILLVMKGICQSEIQLDPHLNSVSDSWQIKVRQNGTFGKKPALISFGPLKTVNTDLGKRKEATKTVARNLSSKDIHEVKTWESNMDLLIDPADTVSIELRFVKEDIRSEQSVFGRATNTGTDDHVNDEMANYVKEMTLRFSGDSSSWYFIRMDSTQYPVYARLEKTGDTAMNFLICRTLSLSGGSSLFKQPSLGYIFIDQGNQVAAFSTVLKETAWISKTLSPEKKASIMATIAAMMGTLKAGNSSGF